MHHSFVFGYHGCAASVAHDVLNGKVKHLKLSKGDSEWLGEGVYFWENNYRRAQEWAEEHIKGEKTDVIGAIIDPGTCFDLTDSSWLAALGKASETFEAEYQMKYGQMPKHNKGLHRPYDCALINHFRENWQEINPGRVINTVRGAFSEGDQIGASSFYLQNHIQWAVLTPDESIIGYFRPTEAMFKLL